MSTLGTCLYVLGVVVWAFVMWYFREGFSVDFCELFCDCDCKNEGGKHG